MMSLQIPIAMMLKFDCKGIAYQSLHSIISAKALCNLRTYMKTANSKMNKTRIEAFIDAILAIILTVLVLEFHTPTRPSLLDLLSEWRTFASYTATFVLIIFTISSK